MSGKAEAFLSHMEFWESGWIAEFKWESPKIELTPPAADTNASL